ncbi:hypothetical protein GVN20_26000 [Runella sp. CRIBMP]|uniref:hypothetical protein n=1 Tax=Runella sp. CRIBMP TaxID=2683261 RepID=UPI001412174B|nr:hypothetical protein [Runella sp. CRIBMP]NBB22836.1 hypothetical protein [Runella sp. CRIBMP]
MFDIPFINIKDKNKGVLYYYFSNSDNKYWLIPDIHSRTAFNIYQPTSVKGKILKFCFSFFKNVDAFRRSIGVVPVFLELDISFYSILCNCFNTKDVEISIFGGTPSNHQKITVQIFNKSQILGYCKITDSSEIKNLFIKEKNILEFLKNKGLLNIPECILLSDYKKKYSIFIQSSIKTNDSQILHDFKLHHWSFLCELFEKTKLTLPFKETDYYKSLEKLKLNICYVEEHSRSFVLEKLSYVHQYYVEVLGNEYSVYHGDFTPWNTYYEERLQVFDFEYAKLTYPPFLDWYHFFTQVQIFKNKSSSTQIINGFNKNIEYLNKYIPDPKFLYTCYLLDVISFYIDRDKSAMSNDVKKNINIWIELLNML